MDYQIFMHDIDFSDFDIWWKLTNPSIACQPTHIQANPVYLPVIVNVGSLASERGLITWYQRYYSFYVPIVIAVDGKITLDESRYTDYNITNSVDVNDIRFKM